MELSSLIAILHGDGASRPSSLIVLRNADGSLCLDRTQWLTLIMACFFGTIVFIVVPETYAPVLLARRAKRLRHETGNWALHAKHEERRVDLKEIAQKYLTRPAKMMFQEPILALMTIYLSFVFGEFHTPYKTTMMHLRR